MYPFTAGEVVSTHALPGHIASAHRPGKDGAKIRAKATAHQKYKKNEAREKERQKSKRRENS